MPSSDKTGFLKLNRWLGSDKPKKDDFNSDNDKVDTACQALAGDLSALSAQVAGLAETGGSASEAMQALDAHSRNSEIHVTAQEKAAWGQGGGVAVVVGTYVGNGELTRLVPLGFIPKCGVLFASTQPLAQASFASEECLLYAGFFSSLGCSRNIKLRDGGIEVTQTLNRPLDGSSCYYNQKDVTYVYLALQ